MTSKGWFLCLLKRKDISHQVDGHRNIEKMFNYGYLHAKLHISIGLNFYNLQHKIQLGLLIGQSIKVGVGQKQFYDLNSMTGGNRIGCICSVS